MTDPVEHPRLGSQPASVQSPNGDLDRASSDPEDDSYEWHLRRCKNPALFHLITVGASMQAIRDRELFRPEYRTWADFCREELGLSLGQAERRIHCTDIVLELQMADCVHLPFNEAQCRPLMRLESGLLRVYAWELTCSLKPVGKAPTGEDVMRAVRLLEAWRPPINEKKREFFDLRKMLYVSRINIKLAEQIFNSKHFQDWLDRDSSIIERRLLKTLVKDLTRRLNSLQIKDSPLN
jgi:hypothetical protein